MAHPVLRHLDTDACPTAPAEVEEVHHHLEPLGFETGRQRPAQVLEIVDAREVDHHGVAVVGERLEHVEVLPDGDMDHLLAPRRRDGTAVQFGGQFGGQVGVGGCGRVTGVGCAGVAHAGLAPSSTGVPVGSMNSTCTLAPAPESLRRFMISFVSIRPCRVSMAWISVSGVGGQPGAYTSTGTTWSTPCTMA